MSMNSGNRFALVLCAALSAAPVAAAPLVRTGTDASAPHTKPVARKAADRHTVDTDASNTITGIKRARRRPDGQQVIKQRVGGHGTLPDRGGRIYEGVVEPGNSPGCIDDEGSVTFSGTSRLVIEIGGATPCSGHDRFGAAGALTLQGGTLEVLLINDFPPAAGDVFNVLDWGTLSGTFSNVDLSQAALGEGLSWDLSRLYTDGELVVAGSAEGVEVPLPGWSQAALAAMLLWRARRKTGVR